MPLLGSVQIKCVTDKCIEDKRQSSSVISDYFSSYISLCVFSHLSSQYLSISVLYCTASQSRNVCHVLYTMFNCTHNSNTLSMNLHCIAVVVVESNATYERTRQIMASCVMGMRLCRPRRVEAGASTRRNCSNDALYL